MKQMPNYYRRNAAQGAARRVMNGTIARADDMRETVGQVVTLCLLMVLPDVTGWSSEEIDVYLRCLTRATGEYCSRAAVDAKAAKKWLNDIVRPLVFVLPPDKPLKNRAARDELAQKRMGCELVWKMFCAALVQAAPAGCGVDKETAQQVLDEARDYYENRFLDWAKEGDGYGWERLKRDVKDKPGECIDCLDDGKGSVFSDRIY